MIRYPKVYWGLLTLTYLYGSAIPRALPFSVAAAVMAACLEEFTNLGAKNAETDADGQRKYFLHPYPFQAFAFIAGFMIVFRYGVLDRPACPGSPLCPLCLAVCFPLRTTLSACHPSTGATIQLHSVMLTRL